MPVEWLEGTHMHSRAALATYLLPARGDAVVLVPPLPAWRLHIATLDRHLVMAVKDGCSVFLVIGIDYSTAAALPPALKTAAARLAQHLALFQGSQQYLASHQGSKQHLPRRLR
jgi:hypothetical protein